MAIIALLLETVIDKATEFDVNYSNSLVYTLSCLQQLKIFSCALSNENQLAM